MDDEHFDQLTKGLVRRADRRSFVAGLAGAVVGGLFGGHAAAAALCRMPGRLCSRGADCCSGVCGPRDGTGHRTCRCQSPADCPAAGRCRAATCVAGACGIAITVGASCHDGRSCMTDGVCQNDGTCRGTPVVCPPRDACHLAGTCVTNDNQNCRWRQPKLPVARPRCHPWIAHDTLEGGRHEDRRGGQDHVPGTRQGQDPRTGRRAGGDERAHRPHVRTTRQTAQPTAAAAPLPHPAQSVCRRLAVDRGAVDARPGAAGDDAVRPAL